MTESPVYSKDIQYFTDVYFTKTARTAEKFGDMTVTYAVFLRRACIATLNPSIEFLKEYYPNVKIERNYDEGAFVEPNKKLMSITGSFIYLAELETQFLQKVGFPCVSAYNAYQMAISMPNIPFVAMEARHTTGRNMMFLAEYGASVGTKTANMMGAKGFVGTSINGYSYLFGKQEGFGTIPHALIGYAYAFLRKNGYSHSEASQKATQQSVEMFIQANTDEKNVIALVDYFGNEVTDAISTAQWFYNQKEYYRDNKKFGVRLDTHGKRFMEGLDYETSVKIVANWLRIPGADEYEIVRHILGNDVSDTASDTYIDKVRKVLFAQGVSAASIIHMRKSLNKAGFNNAMIIASSGFDPQKTKIMSKLNVPMDMIGTGSYTPKTLDETHATADVYCYDQTYTVKVGRENLIQ